MTDAQRPAAGGEQDGRVGFQRDAFAAALRAIITERNVSDRRVCREAGLTSSTATRVLHQGHGLSVEALIALADWAGLSLDAFVVRREPLLNINPLNETAILRTRVDALARETQALYHEGLRLAQVSDRQEAELHRLRAATTSEVTS